MSVAQGAYVLGAQGNLWTEYIADYQKLEYMAYPRAIALSTALWSETKPDYNSFLSVLLQYHFPFLEKKKVNFSKTCLKPEIQTKRKANGGIEIFKTPAKGIIAYEELIRSIPAAKRKIDTYDLSVDQGKSIPAKQIKVIAHKALGAQINFQTLPNPKYDNGSLTIVDGQLGARPWKGNEWLGFNTDSVSFDIVLDKPIKVKEIRIHSLHDPNSWIWSIQSYLIQLNKFGREINISDAYNTDETFIMEIKDKKVKQIHIVLYGLSKIPEGQPGAGNTPWLFIDEIEIR